MGCKCISLWGAHLTPGDGGGTPGAALRMRPVASFTAGWGRCPALSHLWSGALGVCAICSRTPSLDSVWLEISQ